MTEGSTYRPGDIAMMRFRPGGGPEWRPAVRMRGYLPDRDTWHALDSGVWLSNPEVGPVLGNVADIAESENQKYEAAMDDYAAHTTHGNTWIEENE